MKDFYIHADLLFKFLWTLANNDYSTGEEIGVKTKISNERWTNEPSSSSDLGLCICICQDDEYIDICPNTRNGWSILKITDKGRQYIAENFEIKGNNL